MFGSGRLTSFWHDVWSPMGKFFDLLGSRGIIDMGIANHASVATVMETHRRHRHRVNTLNQIEDHIDIARHASNDGDDCPLWRFKNDCYKRKFSTKQTWHQIREVNPICEWHAGMLIHCLVSLP